MLCFIFHLFHHVKNQLGDFEGNSPKPYNIVDIDIMALFRHEFHNEPEMIVNNVVFMFIVIFWFVEYILILMVYYVQKFILIALLFKF